MPYTMSTIIKNCPSSDKECKCDLPDGDKVMFKIFDVVMQGNSLLFVTVLDYALPKSISRKEEELLLTLTPRRSGRIPTESLSDLDFADDIVLMINIFIQAQQLLANV